MTDKYVSLERARELWAKVKEALGLKMDAAVYDPAGKASQVATQAELDALPVKRLVGTADKPVDCDTLTEPGRYYISGTVVNGPEMNGISVFSALDGVHLDSYIRTPNFTMQKVNMGDGLFSRFREKEGESIRWDAWGTSAYLFDSAVGQPSGVASLDSTGKVPAEQLPAMDYDPSGSAAAVQTALDTHTGNTANPHSVTAAQVGARPATWTPSAADVGALPLTGGTLTGSVAMGGNKVTGLGAPTAETDAARLADVTSAVAGVRPPDNSVLLVSPQPPIPKGTPLADATWEQIEQIANMGLAPSYWAVEDEKDIVVAGETLTMQIYGFNHDDLADGSGKAAITFGQKHLMADKRQMSSTNTNVGGFTGSEMYAWLQGDLYNALPADLKPLIQSVNKKTSVGNQSRDIITSAMKIFFFSEVECFGTTNQSVSGEGSQYPIFTDNASRIKKLSNGTEAAAYWWERSPYANNSNYFCRVSNNSNASYDFASATNGVCFGFCIGSNTPPTLQTSEGTDITAEVGRALGVRNIFVLEGIAPGGSLGKDGDVCIVI